MHNEAGLVYPLPYAYLQKVRALPGVVGGDQLDLVRRRLRGREGRDVPELRGRARRHRHGLGRLEDRPAARSRTSGATATARSSAAARSQRYGWKIGDLVTLKGTLYPVDLLVPDRRRDPERTRARTSGSSASTSSRRCARAGIEPRRARTRSGCASTIRARVEPLMREIDEMFRNSEAQTASETEKSYFKNFFSAARGLRRRDPARDGARGAVHRLHRREHREHGRARARCARSRS